MKIIVGTVGKGGKNNPDDVRTVQTLLNQNIAKLTPLMPVIVSGTCDSQTMLLIEEFQRRVMGVKPDGRVDPGKRTIAVLNGAPVAKSNDEDEDDDDDTLPDYAAKPFHSVGAFPLPFVPKLDWHRGGRGGKRYFGAPRKDGRKHAGCDLIAPKGTEIFAVDEGTIINGPYDFYNGTDALEVRHRFFVVRYGEILKPEKYGEIRKTRPDLKIGSKVEQGQLIAHVGKMKVDSMLHFEMYHGSVAGPLTNRKKKPFQRRSDLINPTDYLDYWARLPLPSSET